MPQLAIFDYVRLAGPHSMKPKSPEAKKFLPSLCSHKGFRRMPLRGSQYAPLFRENLRIMEY
jgi:hypothetical protein